MQTTFKTKILKISLFIFIHLMSFIVSCTRPDFNDAYTPSDVHSVNEPATEANNDAIYPEVGTEGDGLNSGGQDLSGIGFRAYLWKSPRGWFIRAFLRMGGLSALPVKDAVIKVFLKGTDDVWKCFKLNEDKDYYSGRYTLYGLAYNVKRGKKVGYFHILKPGQIDYKIGFGVEHINIESLTLNGANPEYSIRYPVQINRGSSLNLNISISTQAPTVSDYGQHYFEVFLAGLGGHYRMMNQFITASTGTVSLDGSIVSRFWGKRNGMDTVYHPMYQEYLKKNGFDGEVFVSPHTVYFLRPFYNPKVLFDGGLVARSDSHAMHERSFISVKCGDRLGLGIRIRFLR